MRQETWQRLDSRFNAMNRWAALWLPQGLWIRWMRCDDRWLRFKAEHRPSA